MDAISGKCAASVPYRRGEAFESSSHAQQKQQLLEKTGIDMRQLLNWFTNARKRIWKPMMKRKLEQRIADGLVSEAEMGQFRSSSELLPVFLHGQMRERLQDGARVRTVSEPLLTECCVQDQPRKQPRPPLGKLGNQTRLGRSQTFDAGSTRRSTMKISYILCSDVTDTPVLPQ